MVLSHINPLLLLEIQFHFRDRPRFFQANQVNILPYRAYRTSLFGGEFSTNTGALSSSSRTRYSLSHPPLSPGQKGEREKASAAFHRDIAPYSPLKTRKHQVLRGRDVGELPP